jgi:hypothetical protein
MIGRDTQEKRCGLDRKEARMKYLAVLIVLVLAVVFISPASAHELTVASADTNCFGACLSVTAADLTPGDQDQITYTFTLTPVGGGTPMTVSGQINFVADASGSYNNRVCFDWLSTQNPLTSNFNVTGSATLVTPVDSSTLSIDFSGSGTVALTCGGSPPVGKTFSMSNSMEGDLSNIRPGDWISGGYSFKFVSTTHAATSYTVTTSVTLPVYCPDGGGSGGNIVIPLGTQTLNIPANDTNWHQTGDQNNILSWEGAVKAPDLCGGNRMRNQIGATFTATVSQNPQVSLVDWRFHYRDPAAKGKPNTNCTDASDPNRNRADVCGASWSQTLRDP